MCGPDNSEYAESYFESIDSLDNAKLGEFMQSVVARIRRHWPNSPIPTTPSWLCTESRLIRLLEDFRNLAVGRRGREGPVAGLLPRRLRTKQLPAARRTRWLNYLAFPITASDVEVRQS